MNALRFSNRPRHTRNNAAVVRSMGNPHSKEFMSPKTSYTIAGSAIKGKPQERSVLYSKHKPGKT